MANEHVVTTPPPEDDDGLDADFLAKVAGTFRRLRDYTRLKVDGLDNVPPNGPALLVGNHTGWLGLDYALTALSIHDAIDRFVRGMAHEAWFANQATARFAHRVGLFQVTKNALLEQVQRGHLVMMFPEGEKGAFRPGSDYTLEPFARGFVRVALQTGVPVIPVCILGGAEANPVGTRIQSYEELINLKGGLPIPRNLIPKPVKWRIRFLSPMDFGDATAQDIGNSAAMHTLADATRNRIQREIRKMKVERGHPYL